MKEAEQSMSRNHGIDAQEKASTLAFYEATPPSRLCADGPAKHPEMKPGFFADVCGDYAKGNAVSPASPYRKAICQACYR